ncbi:MULTISPECIES: conjugal transfer protein TraF [Vibrio]|uniref:Type IX secretion system membrane protein PorP/SprF n=1 Tax=Vibrio paracholerae TaxID=650003 RepID=A0ABD7G0T2_9VIBR|nr:MULTISPECIES: conjugal transfer protein TraF [Vibrio]EJL6522772.1 conjugal transfer protein TraF [Vibrio cholerae]OFJ28157.1 conjugal transfer protein TraF [Vibrio paracholerae]RBM72532.1 type IX secretion system membrane protein PorP/SprF [Vibrio paracholerae]TXX48320.1 conjugal transfer protein TraF [Vibrio cholerae]TYA07826.1 conjugal transfer protein TraF [Vibrio cholerae]
MKKKFLSVGFALIFTSPPTFSANYAIEARGDAMGGVGVVSGNFLTGPFYNPALVAIYRRNDDVGMILPSIGLSYNDPNDLVTDLDKVSEIIKRGSESNLGELNKSLTAMQGDVLNAELGGVVAFAIPNQFISANVFGKAYTESFVSPLIDNTACTESEFSCQLDRAKKSSVNAVSVGITELGITLAKYQTFLGQHIAFGITPKLQRVYTYVYEARLDSYDIKDLRDNGNGETIFNMDAGALWFYGPIRIGFAANNLISREIKTKTITSAVSGNPISYSYDMKPQYTVGAGIVADYFTLSVDYDLNEEERYKDFKDNTQMIRVGGEIDIMRQLKLRAGYNKNLAYDNTKGTVTAGIGLSPLNLFQLDLGASYTNENAMGAYINFLASY